MILQSVWTKPLAALAATSVQVSTVTASVVTLVHWVSTPLLSVPSTQGASAKGNDWLGISARQEVVKPLLSVLTVPGVHETPDVSTGSWAAEAGSAGLQSETETVWHCRSGLVASHVPILVQVSGHAVWHFVVALASHELTFSQGVHSVLHWVAVSTVYGADGEIGTPSGALGQVPAVQVLQSEYWQSTLSATGVQLPLVTSDHPFGHVA